MEQIEIKCKTGGFKFGSIVEVGDKKGQIKQQDAESLVKEGLAVEYTKPVTASTTALKNENTKLANKIEELETALSEKDAKIKELEAALKEPAKTK